jgi:hypothetical protein
MVDAIAHDDNHESDWVNEANLKDPLSGVHCCGKDDCHPVPAGGIEERGNGYLDKETGDLVPKERVIWKSPDGRWWHCLWQWDQPKQTRCLIGPPPSS